MHAEKHDLVVLIYSWLKMPSIYIVDMVGE